MKNIPEGYKNAFQSILESKGEHCTGNYLLCQSCPILDSCAYKPPKETLSAVLPYFEQETTDV